MNPFDSNEFKMACARTAAMMLATLEARIGGKPSITVHDRKQSLKLLAMAIKQTIIVLAEKDGAT
jgi:hypothetical protein